MGIEAKNLLSAASETGNTGRKEGKTGRSVRRLSAATEHSEDNHPKAKKRKLVRVKKKYEGPGSAGRRQLESTRQPARKQKHEKVTTATHDPQAASGGPDEPKYSSTLPPQELSSPKTQEGGDMGGFNGPPDGKIRESEPPEPPELPRFIRPVPFHKARRIHDLSETERIVVAERYVRRIDELFTHHADEIDEGVSSNNHIPQYLMLCINTDKGMLNFTLSRNLRISSGLPENHRLTIEEAKPHRTRTGLSRPIYSYSIGSDDIVRRYDADPAKSLTAIEMATPDDTYTGASEGIDDMEKWISNLDPNVALEQQMGVNNQPVRYREMEHIFELAKKAEIKPVTFPDLSDDHINRTSKGNHQIDLGQTQRATGIINHTVHELFLRYPDHVMIGVKSDAIVRSLRMVSADGISRVDVTETTDPVTNSVSPYIGVTSQDKKRTKIMGYEIESGILISRLMIIDTSDDSYPYRSAAPVDPHGAQKVHNFLKRQHFD